MRHVAVIIPFFQREPGLLRRAVLSILGQQDHAARVTVVVTDDASPVSAGDELSDLRLPSWAAIDTVRTANGGAAVARNVAIQRIPQDADVVAFLDSDDQWLPEHLSRALAHLGPTHPLYFSDLYREAAGHRLFDRWPMQLNEAELAATTDPLVYRIGRETASRLVFDGYVVTSTVVALRSAVDGLGFPEGYYRFGEDQYFFLSVLRRTTGALLSRHLATHYGTGVSIYSDQEFGTRKNVLRLLDEAAFREQLARSVDLLPASLRASNREKLSMTHTTIGMNLLASSLRRDLHMWREVVSRQPDVLRKLPAAIAAMLRAKRRVGDRSPS